MLPERPQPRNMSVVASGQHAAGHFLNNLTSCPCKDFDIWDFAIWDRRGVERVWWAIESGVFYPAPSAMSCSTCGYRAACRAWAG
jgi:hypothetical protein